ncbi:MAG: class I SAM-dependent methyltransferase, partial [Bacillota bacterium]|nr:class I SAM-dependent methyltransferase [Bacillota bacterium]
AARLLRPGGVFLNHGTCLGTKKHRGVGPSFSGKYVFPDGELTPVTAQLQIAADTGLEVRDLESLREHYAITLRHWVRRLENMHERALEFVDEPTYRVWRLFMSGGAFAFTSGILSVFQVLYVKPEASGNSRLPLTRNDWYRSLVQQRTT